MQRLRAQSDAVITGVGTVAQMTRSSMRDEELSEALKQPLRVVLDSGLRAPPNRQIFSDGTLVVHGLDQAARYGQQTPGAVEYLALAGGPRNLTGLLEALAERGCNSVLVEAGPKILGSFLKPPNDIPLWMNGFALLRPWPLAARAYPSPILLWPGWPQPIEQKSWNTV